MYINPNVSFLVLKLIITFPLSLSLNIQIKLNNEREEGRVGRQGDRKKKKHSL